MKGLFVYINAVCLLLFSKYNVIADTLDRRTHVVFSIQCPKPIHLILLRLSQHILLLNSIV